MRYFFLLLLMYSCSSPDGSSGNNLFEQGDYKQAISEYNDHLENNPSDINAIYNRGRAYEEIGKIELAVTDFELVIKKEPDHLKAYLSLAKLYYDQKNFNKSLINSGKAIKIADNSAVGYFIKARAEHQLGFSDQALESYNEAILIDKDYGEAFLYRGALKVSLQYKSACDDFKKARQLEVSGSKSAFSKYCR